ncbi:hypothetical protein VNO78_19626 [Psophocarpus tetragonolobus]|uniref:Uncharacterized protein n=1 Tax=Psophocarpus tetragonolobus TaxID=3891 RepID=A0AAN9S9D4_PSOTE
MEVRGKYHCHVCNQSRLLRAAKDLLLLSLSQLYLCLSLSPTHKPPPLPLFPQDKTPFFHHSSFNIASAKTNTPGMVNYDILILDW